VLNLLSDIREQRRLTYLLVSHGRIVEVLDRAA
jgi:ABC-type dipeptide/oligopeptide/nickel transport system ATPase subunit